MSGKDSERDRRTSAISTDVFPRFTPASTSACRRHLRSISHPHGKRHAAGTDVKTV
jgi:hypothetical protein